MTNYYEILGVSQSATQDEINAHSEKRPESFTLT